MIHEKLLGVEQGGGRFSLRHKPCRLVALTDGTDLALPGPWLWVIVLTVRKLLESPLLFTGHAARPPPAPMSNPTSLEREPNSSVRGMESFDVSKTCTGEREPLQLILRFQP